MKCGNWNVICDKKLSLLLRHFSHCLQFVQCSGFSTYFLISKSVFTKGKMINDIFCCHKWPSSVHLNCQKNLICASRQRQLDISKQDLPLILNLLIFRKNLRVVSQFLTLSWAVLATRRSTCMSCCFSFKAQCMHIMHAVLATKPSACMSCIQPLLELKIWFKFHLVGLSLPTNI